MAPADAPNECGPPPMAGGRGGVDGSGYSSWGGALGPLTCLLSTRVRAHHVLVLRLIGLGFSRRPITAGTR